MKMRECRVNINKKSIIPYIEDMNYPISIDEMYCDDNDLYFEEDKIKVYLKSCSKFVHACGVVISGATKADEENTYIIYTDNIYDEFPKKYQEAFIAHEIGHILSGSVDKITDRAIKIYNNCKDIHKTREKMTGRNIAYELEADRYAAGVVGVKTMIGALNYYTDNYIIEKEPFDEVVKRIKKLRAME